MKILFATDGTFHSELAIRVISKFKFTDGDEIKIISVVDMAVPFTVDVYSGYLPSTLELEKGFKAHAERILETTKKQIIDACADENLNVTTELLIGSPERQIVETAEEMSADLIIVGSHGYNRWERLLLGSVSDSVVHHAPCSVLVVREPHKSAK